MVESIFSCRITKQLGNFTLDLAADCPQSVLAVFGPSGSGKSSLLRCVAGLLRPDAGFIRIGEETLFDEAAGISLPPEKRRIGLVPQDGLLFPHLSVEENLHFGRQRAPRGERHIELGEVAQVLELGPLLARRPRYLSGGERQRVALGRALLASPKLLLFDEPLASVDQALKGRILPYLTRALAHFRIPALYVSHDPAEVLAVASHILVINAGSVVACGDYREIIDLPGVYGAFSREGVENVLRGKVTAEPPGEGYAEIRVGEAAFRVPPLGMQPGDPVSLSVRAGDIILAGERPPLVSARNVLNGRVSRIADVDGLLLAHIDVGCELIVELTPSAVRELHLETGAAVWCLIKSNSFAMRMG